MADPANRRPVRIELEPFADDDIIAQEIREAGTFFEIELLEHLALHGPANGVFIDVGANVGSSRVQGARPDAGVEVQVASLDRLEGLELDVLHGAPGLLRTHRPHLVIELASRAARTAVRRFLADYGYEDIGRRFGWTPTYHFIDPSMHRLRDSPTARRPMRRPTACVRWRRSSPPSCRLAAGSSWWIKRRSRAGSCSTIGSSGRSASGTVRWLEYYADFADHLRRHGPPILSNDRFIAFRLPP
jgi:hypothetical protein